MTEGSAKMADSRGPEMGCASLNGERDIEMDEGELDTVGDDWVEAVDEDKGLDRVD